MLEEKKCDVCEVGGWKNVKPIAGGIVVCCDKHFNQSKVEKKPWTKRIFRPLFPETYFKLMEFLRR